MSVLRSLFGNDAGIIAESDFQALLLANLLAPLGTALFSPISDSLIGPFDASVSSIGLMMSFFTAPAVVMIPVGGILADRYGRKPILVPSLLLFGLAGSAIAFTTDFRVALALRLVQGVAFGGLTPIIITSIGDIYDGTKEATAQGFRFAGSGLTQTVFPILSGLLVVVAWQYPFLLYAIAVPVAIAVASRFEEPAVAKSKSDGGEVGSQVGALLSLLRQRRVFMMVVTRGLPMFVWTGFLTYNSIVVVRILDGTSAQAGLFVAIGSLMYAVGASQTGRLSAMFDSRLYPLIGANVLLGAGFLAFLFAPSLPVAGLGIVVSGLGFGVVLATYRSIVTGLATESLRGGLVSIAEAGGRMTATLAPVIMGAAIAFATPRMGETAALQVAGVGVVAIGSVGGVASLLAVSASPPVRHEESA